MSVREQRMQSRREAIYAAALRLLIEGGVHALTIRALAAKAGVSVPTIYNLIGSRSQILLDLTVARIEEAREVVAYLPDMSAHEKVLAIQGGVADFYIEQADEAKAIYRARMSIRMSEPESAHPDIAAGSASVTATTIREGVEKGEFSADTNVAFAAEQIFRSFGHCMSDWVLGVYDDDGLRSTVAYFTCLHLLPISVGPGRQLVEDKIRELGTRVMAILDVATES